MPPSTHTFIRPLTKLEASLARNTAGPTRSSVVPHRAAGVFAMMNWSNGWRLPSAWRSPQRRRLRRLDVSRPDAVALDVVFAVLAGNVLRQHLQAALCSRIRAHRLAPQLAHHAADVDDLSVSFSIIPGITALLTMNGVRVTSTTCRNCAAVISHIGMRLMMPALLPNVDDAHFLGDLLHHRLHRVLVRYVAHTYPWASRPASSLYAARPLSHQLLPDVIEYDGRARLRHAFRDGKTDAVARACYQRYLAFQRKNPSFPFLPSCPRALSARGCFLCFYRSSVVGITSMSSNAWFSPPIAQMNVVSLLVPPPAWMLQLGLITACSFCITMCRVSLPRAHHVEHTTLSSGTSKYTYTLPSDARVGVRRHRVPYAARLQHRHAHG